MVDIKPFKGYRPRLDLVEKVAALPYDVSSAEEVQSKRINPYSFYHITRSEIDVTTGAALNSREVYEKAKENLVRFIQEGILVQDERPCYYIYTITMNGREQTALVCLSSLKDYEQNRIKKHEFTRPDRVLDRVENIVNTSAHTGLVFLAYKKNATINDIIKHWIADRKPLYDFVAEDSVGHKFWVVDDEQINNQISSVFANEVEQTYIADGHHRSAAALDATKELYGLGGSKDYYLTAIFPDDEVFIMDYNRVVRDLDGLSSEEFLVKLAKDFDIVYLEHAFKPIVPRDFGMYLDGKWYCLRAKPEVQETEDNIEKLGVSILQKYVLSPLLSVGDPRVDERIDFVGGIRDTAYLEKLVDEKQFAVAFTCCPVTMQQLFDVADSGKVMPPKSTWFEPKTRDGLVLHLIS